MHSARVERAPQLRDQHLKLARLPIPPRVRLGMPSFVGAGQAVFSVDSFDFVSTSIQCDCRKRRDFHGLERANKRGKVGGRMGTWARTWAQAAPAGGLS